MISPDDIVKSSQTNGPLVRFVGRNKVRDGFLNQFVCVLLPILVVIDLIYARMARKSWNDVWFQFFGYGTPPSLPCYLEQPMAVRKLRFVCISDTHMMHEKLTIPKGDVLLHTGDFTNHGSQDEVEAFAVWLAKQPHAIKIVIPGNHDMIMDQEYYESYWSDWSRVKQDAVKALKSLTDIPGCHVLIDKGIHIEGVNIWGSPWVPRYAAWRTAFNKSPEEMEEHWKNTLPQGGVEGQKRVDVLCTHVPPLGIGDMEPAGAHKGCPSLLTAVQQLAPKYHVFGHCHSDYGATQGDAQVLGDQQKEGYAKADTVDTSFITFINAASVSDYYWVGSREAICFDMPCHSSEEGNDNTDDNDDSTRARAFVVQNGLK